MATPYATVEVDSVLSTQDEARRWFAEEGDGARPVLLIAARQLQGRGRLGHEWWPAPRALACSLAIREPFTDQRLGLVPLMAGLAARRAIAERCGVDVQLDWPNDLVTSAGKVGGILVERSAPVLVLGCGVNLWWPDPPAGAAGLLGGDPGPGLAAELARAWSDRCLAAFAARRWDRDAYLAASATVGSDLEWDPDGSGTAVDIDEAGGLVVHTVGGRVTLRAGEVRHVRPATLSADHGSATEGDR